MRFDNDQRRRLHKRVGEVLLESGLISISDLDWLLQLQNTKRQSIGELARKYCNLTNESIEQAIRAHLRKCYPDVPEQEQERLLASLVQ